MLFDLRGKNYKDSLYKYVTMSAPEYIRPLLQIAKSRIPYGHIDKIVTQLFDGAPDKRQDYILVALLENMGGKDFDPLSVLVRVANSDTAFARYIIKSFIREHTGSLLGVLNSSFNHKKAISYQQATKQAVYGIVRHLDLLDELLDSEFVGMLHKALRETLFRHDQSALLKKASDTSAAFREYLLDRHYLSAQLLPGVAEVLRQIGADVRGPMYTRAAKKGVAERSAVLKRLEGKDHDNVLEALDTGVWPESDLENTLLEVRITGPSGGKSFYVQYGYHRYHTTLRWRDTTSIAEYLKAFKPTPIETIAVYALD